MLSRLGNYRLFLFSNSSDKFGRKVFLIAGGFILTGVVFAYTLITSLLQLYIVGVMAALSMMGGGFVVGQMGYKIIFYTTASIIFISTLMLFYIREK